MKVKTYLGHTVPYGATHYLPEEGSRSAGFTKYKDQEWIYADADSSIWIGHGLFQRSIPKGAIELPKETKPDWSSAPNDTAVWIQDNNPDAGNDIGGWYRDLNSDNKYICFGFGHIKSINEGVRFKVHRRPKLEPEAWVDGLPPAGCECQATWLELPDGGGNDFCDVIIKGYFGGEVWFSKVNGVDGYSEVVNVADCEFRPLKTQDEKDREAFIEKAKSSIQLAKTGFTLEEIFTNLFNAGFTAPKGEA